MIHTRRVPCLALLVCCTAWAADPVSLHDLASFPVGVAVPAAPWPNSLLGSPERRQLVERHFDSITAENAMKPVYLQPEPGRFDFDHADALVAYAKQHGLLVHGHTLVWHKQSPAWFADLAGSPDAVRAALVTHVRTVAGHFAGSVASWDVVNEAFDDEEPSDYRHTFWFGQLGPDYIELAFRTAHEAAPDADLYYNDYDISGALGPAKLDRILAMVRDFQQRRVPIDGIGFQMHIDTQTPALADIRAAFAKAAALGLKVRISELDVAVNQDRSHTVFDAAVARSQERRYADVVRAYLASVPAAQRAGITVWGITDGDSWIPGFRQRPDWPLLFNADFSAKPALRGMADGLAETASTATMQR